MHAIPLAMGPMRPRRRLHLAAALLLLLLLAITGGAPRAFGVPTIPNPSFEANAAFANAPGSIAVNAPIIGWTTTHPANTGLNPVNGVDHFADNGKIPHGTRVLYVRSLNSTTYLSTTITGLTVGAHYKVSFRVNCRTSPSRFYTGCRIGDGPWVPLDRVSSADPPGVHTREYGTFTTYFLASTPSAVMEMYHSTEAFGGDATLLLDDFKIVAATPIQVTNLNNAGPGSLRATIEAAAATPEFNVITFAPALSGKTIDAYTVMVLGDPSGLAIDASTLPRGLILRGVSNSRNIFLVGRGVHLRGLTFTSLYGAIVNDETADPVLISRCTFFENQTTSSSGGAVTNRSGNTVLSQCTFAGNLCATRGGAIRSDGGSMTVEHCTVSGNGAVENGGGISFTEGVLYLFNSIVSGNVSGGSGSDIFNDNGLLVYRGANIAHSIVPGSALGTPPASGPPMLADLADNGGPAETMALQPGSSARNAAVGSKITTDQRGRPVLSGADLGAYEVQRGTFSLVSGNSVEESHPSGGRLVMIARRDGFEGAATVKFTAAPGTASTADFTPITNAVSTFSDAQTSAFQFVAVKPDALVESNEIINLSLNSPTAGALLGSPSAATLTIIDSSSQSQATDSTLPGYVVITSPAASASVPWTGSITITGTASDNKGVGAVRLWITAGGSDLTAVRIATLESPGAASTKWSYTYSLPASSTPANLLIEALATDVAGNESPAFISRSIKLLHPLSVVVAGDGMVSPAGYTPVSHRELGLAHRLTATPSAGSLFAGWIVTGASLSDIGVSAPDLQRTTLNFYHRPGLRVTAQFGPNIYLDPMRSGSFKGVVEGFPAQLHNVGLLDLTVGSTGAFSAKLTLDGSVLNFAGAFDGGGVARFGTSRAFEAFVPWPGRSSLQVSLRFAAAAVGESFEPTVEARVVMLDYRKNYISEMGGPLRHRAATVSPLLLGPGGTAATFNCVIQATPPILWSTSWVPRGHGFAQFTLSPKGTVIVTHASLPDGTTGLTAGTFVDWSGQITLFLPLYGGRGYARCKLAVNPLIGTGFSDLSFTGWGRPFNPDSQHYPYGWPEVIRFYVVCGKYSVPPNASILTKTNGGPLPPPSATGNARLTFEDGLLSVPRIRSLNLSPADIVSKVPSNDLTYYLTIDRATGLFHGTFLHEDGNMIPYKGIILQTVDRMGGFGYFLTATPSPIDYSGEAGEVLLLSPLGL